MIIILIKNQNVNKIIQKLHDIGVPFYNIRTHNNNIYVKIKYSDYERIKKYLITYDISIYKYCGKRKIISVLKKYKYIVTFLIIGFIFIFISSFFIVDINIIHENKELVTLIEDDLESLGIKKFSFRKSYNELEIAKDIIKSNHLDKIDWLEINKVGMKYVVRVEERIITKKEDNPNYCHIYAKKDGIIKSINAYSGEKMVNINDYVKKGDLIISGDIKLNDNTVNKVCADGKVYAESWYITKITIPLEYEERIHTGKIRNNYIVNFKDVDYKIFRDRLKDYESSKKMIGDFLGIKIYKKVDYETKTIIKTMTKKEAINKALSLAKEKVLLKLSDNDKIISEKVLQNKIVHSKMDIEIFVACEEEISKQVIMKEDG